MRKFLRYFSLRRLYYKIVNQEGTPESVARGVGLGLFVGFALPLGTHIIIGIPLAFIMRANKFLMLLFTMPVNPYTITFFYPAQCWIGAKLMGSPLTMKVIKKDFAHVFSDPSWTSFKELGSDVMWPLLLGGLLIGLITGFIGYFATLGMVQRYRMKREKALRRRLSVSSKREKTVCMKVE